MRIRTGSALAVVMVIAGGTAIAADRTVLVEYFTSDT